MPERRRKRTNQDRGTDEVKQDRSLLLYVLLSFVTFSVYHFYFMDLWAKDVNILCEKDGKHTVGVEKMMLFSVLTFGVYKYVWLAEIVDRICDNAAEYDVEVRQDSETFFVWMILVPVLGYLVAMYRAIQDTNRLAEAYERSRQKRTEVHDNPNTKPPPPCMRGRLSGLTGSLAGRSFELIPGRSVELGRNPAEVSLICHVGDCRTYIISDTLTQLTTDHTIVQRELTERKLTPEQARKDSRQSLLLQCVGAGKDVKPDYLSGEVLPHRTFLICCDGFRRKVTEAEIKKSCRYSSKEKKLHEALEETAQLCMKRKETDNITGILISAVGEKKGLFPLWKKATQTAGKKVIVAGKVFSQGVIFDGHRIKLALFLLAHNGNDRLRCKSSILSQLLDTLCL